MTYVWTTKVIDKFDSVVNFFMTIALLIIILSQCGSPHNYRTYMLWDEECIYLIFFRWVLVGHVAYVYD